jgi:hypothetical protein
MRITVLLISLLFNSSSLTAQVNCEDYPDNYIPKNLGDAILFLECKWSISDKEKFKTQNERDVSARYHMGSGMAIRNNWGLWKKKKNSLKKYFNRKGIFHPDDMSGIILTSFHRKLNNRDIELGKQIDYYKKYWERANFVYDSIDAENNKKASIEFESYKQGDTVKIEFKVNIQGKRVSISQVQKYPDLGEIPDCYVTGIVKEKIEKNYILRIQLTDICGHKEATRDYWETVLKVGESYDFFSLKTFKMEKSRK